MDGSVGSIRGFVVVGVVPTTAVAVVERAAEFAARFGTGLACVTVEPDRMAFAEGIDGTVLSYPLDPDSYAAEIEFDPALEARLAPIARAHGVELAPFALVGEPASVLGVLAERVDAPMIVVGSREAGLRGSVREFFAGSVALHLSHRQHRPVVVVPLAPVARAEALPWEDEL
ncbi:nucleotide-binding universal stress UspA family protein [Frigoribacterium sp. PhB160]|jgi:nucleotide-binding universal stress UspA family protein|uniref:universal stress protein n=1 Tax=Frigoribacterium sp. PhB160 TaxID=2485192 RepID=UPI000F46BC56|nr:universal stress protein [Frigoribacterium sp. PhB160]ROS58141.1 nucleotide-binding universal stress UspA family protein [Frigoribacterium sp. PhB160]